MSRTSSQIAQYEQKARSRFFSAVEHIGDTPFSGKFNEFLELNVLPQLVRVGFDLKIAGSLFKISAPGWLSIARMTSPNILIHPALARDIKEIRRDIVSQDGESPQNNILSISTETSPMKLVNTVEKEIHPRTLPEQLQSIPRTWIILPRAFSLLTKNDSRCLIVYLHHLDVETNLAFEQILARILIEFVGNYSLKHISSALPKRQMMEAIFYGYTALFWKNLRQPPTGLEDLLIYRNFLTWAKAFSKRASTRDPEKEEIIAEMEEMQNNVLPDRNIQTLTRRKNNDADGLQIALRHGRPGINHAVRHFTMNSTSFHNSTNDLRAQRTLPKQFNTLSKKLVRNYAYETPETRESIHSFLMQLSSIYNPRKPHHPLNRKMNRDELTFTKGRMAHMIQDCSRLLN